MESSDPTELRKEILEFGEAKKARVHWAEHIEGKAAERENPRDLQKVPLKSSSEYWLEHGGEETIQHQIKNHLKET